MGCTGGDRRGVGEKRRPRVVTPSGPLGGGRGPARVSWAIAARRRLMDAAATGGLMYLDGYGVATTDLGRGRMKSHHYLSHHYLQEVCAIMKPEHGANAVAQGPPVLIRSGRGGNAAATARDRRCPGHPSAGALRRPNSSSTRPARVLHADIAGLPCGPSHCGPSLRAFLGRSSGRPVFGSADRAHPQSTIHNNPQSQTTR